MKFYRAENIKRVFTSGTDQLTVLDDISLELQAGTMTAIVGASGSGKTTLLQILGTLDRPTEGKIFFKDETLTEKNDKELAEFRNKSLGFIFQFHHLLPEFTTLENVMIPAKIGGQHSDITEKKARELLNRVELDQRLNHKVTTLSGGEQQRTALARALIMQPALLLADEPTGNLDSRSGEIVFTLLQELSRERKLSTVMVTHNSELAAKMDRLLVLKDGKIEEH